MKSRNNLVGCFFWAANGVGKSTAAEMLLPPEMTFLNADEVAKTLPGHPSSATEIEAGRIVLESLVELRIRGESFAYESTLSGRSLVNRLKELKGTGYRIRLIYIWSPSADLNVARVADRVRRGGHDVPEWAIRRRFSASWRNLHELYMPLADEWKVYRNIDREGPNLIAEGGFEIDTTIVEPDLWELVMEGQKMNEINGRSNDDGRRSGSGSRRGRSPPRRPRRR